MKILEFKKYALDALGELPIVEFYESSLYGFDLCHYSIDTSKLDDEEDDLLFSYTEDIWYGLVYDFSNGENQPEYEVKQKNSFYDTPGRYEILAPSDTKNRIIIVVVITVDLAEDQDDEDDDDWSRGDFD